MLDVSILILIFIFGLYAGFISRYNIAHHLIIKLMIIIGIIILQFIHDKYANIYTIALGTMLVIPYSSNLKEHFEDAEDKNENKGKKKDDDEDEDDGKKKKKKKKEKKEKKPIIPKIPPKCANQKIKILIPDNINVETEKMMSCKTMTDICFQVLDSTQQNAMCSTNPKTSFSSSAKVDPLPANKRDQLTAENCVHYLSQCIKNGDSVYPGESLCKNLSPAASSGDAI